MKIILILLGIYLFFRYVFPIVLRIAVGKALHKYQQTSQGTNPHSGRGSANTHKEEARPKSTSTSNSKKPIIDDDQGEYVDFIEIK
jgi:hypothetical protein